MPKFDHSLEKYHLLEMQNVQDNSMNITGMLVYPIRTLCFGVLYCTGDENLVFELEKKNYFDFWEVKGKGTTGDRLDAVKNTERSLYKTLLHCKNVLDNNERANEHGNERTNEYGN